MVLYFEPLRYGPGKEDFLIFMGRDKHENEDLIKYGLPLDVWCAHAAPALPPEAGRHAPSAAAAQVPRGRPLVGARLPQAPERQHAGRHPRGDAGGLRAAGQGQLHPGLQAEHRGRRVHAVGQPEEDCLDGGRPGAPRQRPVPDTATRLAHRPAAAGTRRAFLRGGRKHSQKVRSHRGPCGWQCTGDAGPPRRSASRTRSRSGRWRWPRSPTTR